ncbi:flagellar basal body P-ring formation chaperone FlgA [Pseudomaricurvus sp.]|uniref:flagellar basal body P-ring formation chaperone FlgA n=1 Tax=Pseudomaricurvus sp. TaxID=2004510 RepID=UPI003F6BED29
MNFKRLHIALSLGIAVSAASEARQWQDLSDVPVAAQQYLESVLKDKFPDDQTRIDVGDIDPRLRLSACDKPLTYDLHGRQLSASNVTLRVQCPSQTPWSFYLTAKVERMRQVLVAARNIGRGERLTERDFSLELRDVSTMGNSTVSNPTRIIGKEARRPINLGDSLRTTSVTAPEVIQRGDAVSVKAISGGIAVSTSGVAMNDGKVGQQIRVQNLKSERVIKARVTAKGQVQVIM